MKSRWTNRDDCTNIKTVYAKRMQYLCGFPLFYILLYPTIYPNYEKNDHFQKYKMIGSKQGTTKKYKCNIIKSI